MSFRTDILPLVDECRAIAGVDDMDQWTTQLTIRTRVWSGGRVKAGTPADTDLVLPQRYKISQLSPEAAQKILGTGGTYNPGDHVLVRNITQAFAGGGFTAQQLAPQAVTGTEIIYILTGAITGEFELVNITSTRPYRHTLLLFRTNRTPGP